MTKLSVFDPMWYVLVVWESDKDFINKCTSVFPDHFLATKYLQLCLTQDGLLSSKQASDTKQSITLPSEGVYSNQAARYLLTRL